MGPTPPFDCTTIFELVAEAERLVDSCIPVVLLQHGLKAPISGPDGSWIVLTDPDNVPRTVEKAAQYTTPNVGALLAPKADSPLVVVDVDGQAAWPKLKEVGLNSSGSSWIVRTGRGNFHVYYYWHSTDAPPKRTVKAGKLPVDLLSNGYAVIPPSDTYREPKGGGSYRWIKGHSPADIPLAELDPLPGALLGWWKTLAGAPGTQQATGEVIPDGSRNSTLTSLAGTMRRRGFSLAAIEAALLADNFERGQPPLPEREVLRIAHSVSRYPAGELPPQRGPVFVRFQEEAANG